MWLGISPHEQPPHYYRLLGLEIFECHEDVIENAATRQMAHLRMCSVGPRARLAQDLLNQVAAARNCLLDPVRKAEYDRLLRASLAPAAYRHQQQLAEESASVSAPPLPPPHRSAAVMPLAPALQSVSRPMTYITRRPAKKTSPVAEVIKIAVGGIAGLAIGFGILQWLMPGNPLGDKLKSATKSLRLDSTSQPIRPRKTRPALHRVDDSKEAAHPPDSSRFVPDRQSEPSAAASPAQTIAPIGSPSSPMSEATQLGRDLEKGPGIESGPRTPEPSRPAESMVSDGALFPSYVQLPAPSTADWVDLISAAPPITKLQLVPLSTVALDGPRYEAVSVKPDDRPDGSGGRCWNIVWQGGDFSEASRPIAELTVDNEPSALRFRWGRGAELHAQTLANAWLKVETSSGTYHVALSPPVTADAIRIDLERPRSVIPLALDHVPDTTQIYLSVDSLAGMPGGAKFRNGPGEAQLNREVVIEFGQFLGAQLKLKCANIPQSPLGLIVEPVFEESATRKYDLTFKRLAEAEKGFSEALREARLRIPALESQLRQAESQLGTVRGRTVRSDYQARQKVIDLRTAEGIVREANRRLRNEREKEANAAIRLDNAPKLRAFMQELHGRKLPFRVFVKSIDAQLVLVTSGESLKVSKPSE